MRLATRLRAAVGDGLGRTLLIGAFVLAGAATAVGMGAGSSSSGVAAEGPSRSAQGTGAPADGWAIAVRNQVAEPDGRRPRRGGADHYRDTARKHVPAKTGAAFMPLYREAERVFGVNWRLIASIHRQETAFSTAPGTYRGLNAFGCCAGPMQFNVTNGPVSTWKLYRQAFRAGRRPKSYPHRTSFHPSVYDDFDAIMAAGSLLSDSGAGPSLDSSGAWWAAYSYYGHDLFGVTYASQVLARAVGWERDGFCLNCALDEDLVAQFDDAYGASVREQLLAEERRRKERTDRKEARDRQRERRERQGDRRDRRKAGAGGSNDRAPRRPPAPRPRPTPPPSADNDAPTKPAPPPPTPTQPSTTPDTTTPAPPADEECASIKKLLGC